MMADHVSYDRPLNVLTSSINYCYFLIIILSPLRLDAWLCIFTGALPRPATASSSSCMLRILARVRGLRCADALDLPDARRFLLSGGLAAGFVSHRIRTTLIETLGEVQERERVVALFGQHVSPEVVDQLLAWPPREHSELRRGVRHGARLSATSPLFRSPSRR
jgi:adenylate cyclase